MGIKVEAIKKGYYNHKRVKEGDVFFIKDEKAFSKNWMVKHDAKRKKVIKEEEEVKDDFADEVI